MTALLTLLLGATAVLVPPGASSDPRRGAGTRSALAQSAALVLGVLLGITILHLPWWQIAVVALTAGLWTALARFAPRSPRHPRPLDRGDRRRRPVRSDSGRAGGGRGAAPG